MAQNDPKLAGDSAPNSFAALLRLLEQDGSGVRAADEGEPGGAAGRYDALRHRLIRYFTWERCADPELLADETFSRMARRIAEGETIENPRAYLFGIARVLRREESTRRSREMAALGELAARTPPSTPDGFAAEDAASECLAGCLNGLTVAQRGFILRYYQGDQGQRIRNRKHMAQEEGVDLNALRNRALRLRGRLENCARDCLNRRTRP